jgi:hypothetical protein
VRPGLALLALLASATATAAADAQGPALTVTLQSEIPRIQATGLLADGKFVSLMRSGFPLRLHYRLELWHGRSGWFDQFVSGYSWDAVAHHDPLANEFVLIQTGGRVARYATADELEHALEVPYKVALRAKGAGQFYFLCRLEVATLNETDLEELTRWIKGEVGPAVSGDGSLGGALARGAQRLLVRIAGLPRLTLEARSEPFTHGGAER